MREIELKSVVDADDCEARARAAGARLVESGSLRDRRYDTRDRDLKERDEVLRLREFNERASLDWKGPTSAVRGYKVRTEISTPVGDADKCAAILEGLGYVVTCEIERVVAVYELAGATVRVERYPRMDDLVEVEGTERDIEAAIAALGLPRAGFTPERLPDFVRRFEERTGQRAALCAREADGEYRYDIDDS